MIDLFYFTLKSLPRGRFWGFDKKLLINNALRLILFFIN